MKKIVLIITILTLISCSNNDNKDTNPLKEKLKGTWNFVGYYTAYDVDQPDGNFHPIENGGIINFYANNTFDQLLESINYQGTYSVTNDSLLTIFYDQTVPNGPIGGGAIKISLLNDTTLKTTCTNPDSGIDGCETYRYEKITTP